MVPVEGKGVARDIPSLSICLGPNGSYFALDKDGSAWGGLPQSLNDAIAQRRNKNGTFKPNQGPSSVALGYDGAYVFMTKGGGGNWNLKGQNDELDSFLKNAKSFSGIVGQPPLFAAYVG